MNQKCIDNDKKVYFFNNNNHEINMYSLNLGIFNICTHQLISNVEHIQLMKQLYMVLTFQFLLLR